MLWHDASAMSEQNPPGDPMRQSDPWSDSAGDPPGPLAQGPVMPGAMPTMDPDATLPLTPAYGAPPPYGTPPGGWPADPSATQPATQPWGAPPPWAGPGAPGWQAGQMPPPGWVPPGSTPPAGLPYATGDWDPDAGPQAGTAYGTRPPTPPTGNRRGTAGGGSGKTPPAIIIGSVIGVAAILAVAVWFLLLRPGDDTATSTPTPVATTFITPPPTATVEPDATDEPATPEPTRFRNPTFSGLRIADAESLAERSNVTIQVTYEVTDEVDPDTVIAQDPPPGTEVLPGDVVRLTVAAPQPTVAVPDLRGFTEADAVATLLDLDLAAGIRSEAHDPETDAGLIILTDPRGGIAVARGTAIDYLVSLGPEPSPSPTPVPTELPAPELLGLTQDEAQSIADENGFVLDIQSQESLDADPGSVLSQDPAPGTPLRPGDTVVIIVAVRPTTVLVPDVRDLAEADAVAVLLDAGLEPGTRSEVFDAITEPGVVIRTDPRAGIAVAPGTFVDYVISLGAEPTPSPEPTLEPALVPDLVGLSVEEGQALIDDARLVLQVAEERETLDAPEGTILEQDPASDSEVRVGDPVSIVVAVRPGSIAVPVLRGLAEEDAITALLDAALVPGERTERYHASVAERAVIRSDPAAGTIVALDTIVDYVVSLGPEPTPTPEPTQAPIVVPELSGLVLGDVQAYADENGLLLDIVDEETDDAPPDTILEQDPPAGSELRTGDILRVTVARQPANVTVPDLRDLTEEDAIAALLGADLDPGTRTERFHDTIPAGAVIRSTPGAGASVPRGSRVDYFMSVGPQPTPTPSPTPAPITIPAFVGGPLADAQAFADDNGLTLDPAYEETADAPPDTVLEQDPVEGGELRPGGTLRLLVAAAPTTATVPDVRGQLEPDAVAMIVEAGLTAGDRVVRFNDTVAEGAVIRTDPEEGTVLPVGSVVDYIVSRGPKPTPAPVVVPDLRGRSLADARDIADGLGLVLDTTIEETDAAEPDTILDQRPAPGGTGEPGGRVTVVVAQLPPTVLVPDLGRMSEADAIAVLVDADLVPGDRDARFHASMPEGAVIRTDPAAGTEVERGSAVAYTLSRGPEPTPTPSPTPGPITIPAFVGGPLADAQAFADANGLTLDVSLRETADAPPDTVLEQDPAEGGELRPGATLRVSVATPPTTTIVPDVRGQAEDDAISLILEAGLAVGDRAVRFNDAVPQGALVRTVPAAGTEQPLGTAIDYVVSRGPAPTPSPTPEPTPAPVLIPELRGLDVGRARAFAEDSGLVLDVREVETTDAPEGTILDQDPAPGAQLAIGETLAVTVAVAPSLVAVPELRGLSEADGVALLADAGLAPGRRIDRFHDVVPPGAIIRTDPAAASEVAPGTIVDYFVSRGPEPTPVPILAPELRGLSRADAQATIDGLGLVMDVTEVTTDQAAPDTVIDQDPAPGTELADGSAVRVDVAVAPQLVIVPTLRDLSQADGTALLTEAGLVPGRRIDRYNATVAAETIVRTDPEAGAEVPVATVVDYVVSRGPEPTPAPDFVGLDIDAAQALAEANGLALDVIEVDDDSVPTGTVLSQDPAAGDPLTSTTVRVSVARNTALVTVPTLRGLSEADGVALLMDAGLVPGRRIDRFNDAVPAEAIVRTDPEAGAEVGPSTVVDYVVSKGPEPRPVPDLQGLPVGDAERVAGDAGLTLVVTFLETRDVEPDTVISQDPAPDAPGDGSGTVRVVVAQAPSSVLVPRVRGLAEDEALATLRDAGLRIGERFERVNAEIPAGALIGTDPRAETEVAPRTRIDYTVSLGAGGGEATPEPTPEPTAERTAEPTDPGTGGGLDAATVAAFDSVVGQVPVIRELDQLAGIPYTTLTPRQLRRVLHDEYDAQHPQLAAEEATLKRLGLLPPEADLRALTIDLLASRVVAFYDPIAGTLAVVARDGATDAVLRFFAAGQVTKALQGQHMDLGAFTVADPTQSDRINARAAVAGGDQALVMIDWAGQVLSGDEQASLPGLATTDPALLASVPLYVRRVFEFPSTAGVAFVEALRSSGGWDAVNAAFARPPGTTEMILHPEKFRQDRAVDVSLPDLTSTLGGGWSVADQRTLGELGIGIWVDDGQDGSPNAWAADGWGGDRLVRLEGPDGAWAVVWQTAWDSDTDADEFTSAADAAMADLPAAHVVLRGADLAGGVPSPSLVIVASDQGVLDAIIAGTGLGG